MGVGVYTSDFDGTGKTFLVSGPLGRDEDFEEYLKDADEPVSRETWMQDEYDDFNVLLIETVEEAAGELGFNSNDRRGFTADRAEFDSDFVAIAGNDVLGIGWRSWEHDFVIGVAALSDWHGWLTGDADDFLANKGWPVEQARGEYEELVDAVSEYVRIALMQRGIDCRYRTSGYTSSAYEIQGDADTRKAELRSKVEVLMKSLGMEASSRILASNSAQRVALLKEIDSLGVTDVMTIAVPFYDADEDHLLLWDIEKNRPLMVSGASPELLEHARSLPRSGGLAPLEWNDATDDFLKGYLRRRAGDTLIVTVPEYQEAIGDSLTISYKDDDRETVVIEFKGGDQAALPPGVSR